MTKFWHPGAVSTREFKVLRTPIAVTSLTAVALILGTPTAGTQPNAAAEVAARGHGGTTIMVQVKGDRGQAPTALLGVNHQYEKNGRGLWDPNTDAPRPAVVEGAIRAGIQTVRFPGGTVANLYDWKRAIGRERGCQVAGHARPGSQGRVVSRGLDFGPDELMEFVELAGAKANLMVPWVTETPGDAADWVEYMNGQAGTAANPNGGTDWADVRAANGHEAPYGVKWWEIGNEQYHLNSRYWMSRNSGRALRQYAFGGSGVVSGENLGKNCAHPKVGIPSDGAASQTFEALYPPVDPQSFQLQNGGTAWQRVPDLTAAGPDDRVYTLDAESGRVTFGDGRNGAIPSAGSTVRASYRTVHEGYFTFARRMKEVDPSIEVCSMWAARGFNRLVHRPYDCIAEHAITHLVTPKRPRWTAPIEGHDRFMLRSDVVEARIRRDRRSMPPATPLLLSEFVVMHGDEKTFPAWGTSVSHAVYMATLWADWLNMRIRLGNGDDLLGGPGQRSVLGGRTRTFTADAVTRSAIAPMFSAGGQLLTTRVSGNPVRRPPDAPGQYRGLTVAATRGGGDVRLLVVNRLPRSSVTARIRLSAGRTGGTASVRSVTGRSFTSWNKPGLPPSVVLHTQAKNIGVRGFKYHFPPASTTVFRIPWSRG